VLLSDSEDKSALLRNEGAGTIFLRDEELAKGIASHLVRRISPEQSAPSSIHARAVVLAHTCPSRIAKMSNAFCGKGRLNR
jgi:hypothetical protein